MEVPEKTVRANVDSNGTSITSGSHTVDVKDEFSTSTSKPNATPPMPQELKVQEAYQVDFNLPNSTLKYSYKYPTNYIKTTKYTLLTFLPINLFSQFRRFYNIYFLLTAVFAFIVPDAVTVSPFAQTAPLIIVLATTAVKDAVEDYERYKADKIANEKVVNVIRGTEKIPIKSMDLVPGDVLYLSKGEKIPADAMVISTSFDDGSCFVETSELDGETNLKRKYAIPELIHLTTVNDVTSISGRVQCEYPTENLSRFDGRVKVSFKGGKQQEFPLSINQLLLRGTFLRNTDFAYAVIVFAGVDTKIFKNLKNGGLKFSTLEKKMNNMVTLVFMWNLVILILSVVMEGRWWSDFKDIYWYLPDYWENDPTPPAQHYINTFIAFFINYSYTIPVSLFVMMEIVRIVQKRFMMWDEKMKSPTGRHMKVNNSNLNEDLGAIDYVFSDKTGTLTRNVMVLSKFYVEGKVFDESEKPGSLKNKMESCSMDDILRLFVQNILICNTVLPTFESNDRSDQAVTYESQSPDETALLNGLKANGIVLREKRKGVCTVSIFGEPQDFETLDTLEFTSDRKRMSVIVNSSNGRFLFCKGADNIIIDRLRSDHSMAAITDLSRNLHGFSVNGLRTLVFAYRRLSDDLYAKFKEQYEEAQKALGNRDEKIAEACELIERDLTLLGASAIEDRLQDEVPETIEYLLQCQIRVWLLTGDKQETAINIGMSSRLISPEMNLFVLNGTASEECVQQLKTCSSRIQKEPNETYALIVTGDALEHILRNAPLDFLNVGVHCRSVICCRVTPLQKALVVRLVRKHLKVVTLSIGDGANDVSMIQEANIGVGIEGLEGAQAVRASDYAFVEFKSLRRLISVHGRYSYLRFSKMIFFSFYKNIVFIAIQVMFGAYSAWSGTTAYNGDFMPYWNVFYTSAPPFFLACFEKDVGEEQIKKYPQLYRNLRIGQYWSSKKFLEWLLSCIWHIAVVQVSLYGTIGDGMLYPNGFTTDYDISNWLFGGSVLLTVVIKIAMVTQHWVWVTLSGYFITFCCFVGTLGTLELLPTFRESKDPLDVPLGLTESVHQNSAYWLLLFFIPITSILPEFICRFAVSQFFPSDVDILNEEHKYQTLSNSHFDANVNVNSSPNHPSSPCSNPPPNSNHDLPNSTDINSSSHRAKNTVSPEMKMIKNNEDELSRVIVK